MRQKTWFISYCSRAVLDKHHLPNRYVIEKKEKVGTRWLKCCKTPDRKTQFKVTDVDEGSEVQFQVRAENEAGVGDPSEPTVILTIEDPTSKILLTVFLYSFGAHCI